MNHNINEVTLNIEINSSDAAMVYCPEFELSTTLRKLADKLENRTLGQGTTKLKDTNGNTIGEVFFEIDEDEDEDE